MEKKIWQSKVFWLNLIALVGMAVPGVGSFVAANPEAIGSIFAVANIILRIFGSNVSIK